MIQIVERCGDVPHSLAYADTYAEALNNLRLYLKYNPSNNNIIVNCRTGSKASKQLKNVIKRVEFLSMHNAAESDIQDFIYKAVVGISLFTEEKHLTLFNYNF